MTERRARMITCFLVGMLATSLALAQELPSPEPRIEAAIDRVVADVQELRVSRAASNCALYSVADEHLRSHFGLFRTARAMLPEHWPKDDRELQQRFVTAFYDYLVAKYGDLLIHVDSNTLTIFPRESVPETEKASIEAMLTMTDGEEVDVSLTMRFIDDQWRIVDVVSKRAAEGVYSHASGFRDLFLDEIYDVGFDGLIEWLEEKAAPRKQCG